MDKDQKRILIVEDEEATIRVLADRFGQENFQVLKADDGDVGLDTALKEHPDLILLDILMPRMDGIEMLKKLREDSWGKTVPVILLTNVSEASRCAEAAEHGVYDYLVKADWDLDEVVEKVKEKI